MTGFQCKVCGQHSPLGVGYTDTSPGAAQASQQVTSCPCGHSQTAR